MKSMENVGFFIILNIGKKVLNALGEKGVLGREGKKGVEGKGREGVECFREKKGFWDHHVRVAYGSFQAFRGNEF